MSGMNQWLAQCYDTPGAATQEDLQKVAEAEMFAKLASENGLDLNSMSDAEVSDLWNKVAMDEEHEDKKNGKGKPPPFTKKDGGDKDEKKDDEEKEAAAQEFAMQKAASDQIEFMDYCGRVMAHSYVNELTKIAKGMAGEGEKTAGANPLLDHLAGGGAAAATAAAPADVNERIQKLAAAAPGNTPAAQPSSTDRIDFLAAKHAVKLAEAAGIDVNVAAERLNAVLTLGPQESVKLATAENVDQAIEIRGLELLEQAGFEVNWAA